jgi:two-component system nitrate/nitrite response regulator NarL
VLLADSHSQVRWALRTVIHEEPGWVVVGEVSRGEYCLSGALALQPDLILLEWELPGRPADEMLSALHALSARPRVIVLGGRPELRETALVTGADAFVCKTDPPEYLLAALHALAGSQ